MICTELCPSFLVSESQSMARPLLENTTRDDDSTVSLAVQHWKTWPIGWVIIIFFDPKSCKRNSVPPEVLDKVKEYANHWSRFANITFNFLDDHDNADVRVAFEKGHGHYSAVGNHCRFLPKDRPTMNLDPTELNTGVLDQDPHRFQQIVLHEFGHVLGCIHEHSQPNAVIKWNKPYIYKFYSKHPNRWSKQEVDANIFKHYPRTSAQDGSIDCTQFDKLSIMQYQFGSAFTTDGRSMSGGTDLSFSDRQLISYCYPFPDPVHSLGIAYYGRSTGGDETNIPFESFCTNPTQPTSVLFGISHIDTGEPKLSASLSTSPGNFTVTVISPPNHHWVNDRAHFSWLATTVECDFRLQYGIENVILHDTWKKTIHVSYPIPFVTSKGLKVAVWMHSLKSDGARHHSIRVDATPVDTTHFTLNCVRGISEAGYEIGVTWLASLDYTPGIDSGVISIDEENINGEFSLPNGHWACREGARIFMAFSSIQTYSCTTHLSLDKARWSPETKTFTAKVRKAGERAGVDVTYVMVGDIADYNHQPSVERDTNNGKRVRPWQKLVEYSRRVFEPNSG